MNGVDPSPEDIAYQQGLFTGHRAKVFCYNEQVNSFGHARDALTGGVVARSRRGRLRNDADARL